MYKYFISYAWSNEQGGSGFGHVETETSFRISGIENIRSVSASIEEDFNLKKGSVIILNYKLFNE